MLKVINSTNNFQKRTVHSVKAVLKNYIDLSNHQIENMGDNNLFSVTNATIQTKMAIKMAGFIRQGSSGHVTYFKCH
jgi:hypothetical protein